MSIESRIKKLEELLESRTSRIKFKLINGLSGEVTRDELSELLMRISRGEDVSRDALVRVLVDVDITTLDPRDGSICQLAIDMIRDNPATGPNKDPILCEMLGSILSSSPPAVRTPRGPYPREEKGNGH